MHKTLRTLIGMAPALVLILAAAPAGAQQVAKAKAVNTLGGVTLALVLVVLVMVASFLSSRRGHQD